MLSARLASGWGEGRRERGGRGISDGKTVCETIEGGGRGYAVRVVLGDRQTINNKIKSRVPDQNGVS